MDLIIDGFIQAFQLILQGDQEVINISLLSLGVSLSATVISLFIGITLGVVIALTRFIGRRFLVSLINTGMGAPPVVVGLIVSVFLWRSGPLGILHMMYTPSAMILAQCLISLPIIMGFTMASIQQIDPKLRLQILALGASRWQLLWLLVRDTRLPLLAAVMAGFGSIISEVGASMMVGGNITDQTRVLTTAIVMENSKGDFGLAIALGVILMALVYAVNLVLTGNSTTEQAKMNYDQDPVIEASRLEVVLGGQKILEIPSLKVYPHEALIVIGPNGSGKTTLLLCLALLLKPAAGALHYSGTLVEGSGMLQLRRRLAVAFQESLLLNSSVMDNVTLGMHLRGVKGREVNERAMKWLERFGVAALAKRQARMLSGGEAKRVSLARVFVLEPDVLFLDEPFTALDSPTRQSLLEDFESVLRETKVTTVMVTHDRNEALVLADRVAVLMKGAIRQIGTPEEVFGAPVDEDVAGFVEAGNILHGVVNASGDGIASIDVGGGKLQAVSDLAIGSRPVVYLNYEDVTVSIPSAEVVNSSARNQLRGRITRVFPFGFQLKITIDCGFPLAAVITRRSGEELGLDVGKEVVASFKASSVKVLGA